MKFLLSVLLISLFCISGFAQYLPAKFQGKTVSMQLVHDGKYVAGHDAVSAGNRSYQLYKLDNFYSEEWQLQTTGNANWYRIYHVASQRYLTINPITLAIELQPLLTNGTEGLYQQFQFVAETQTDRFKIHSRLPSTGGVDNILQIANFDVNDGTSISLGANQTTGNSDNQKFDLVDLYPSPDPSSATPSLADRFEGRQCGFIVKSDNYTLTRNTTSSGDRIFAYPQFANFEKEFAIEFTSETGWYKIRHRSSGKYITVPQQAIPGNDALLLPDAGTDDNYQKFKFIIQANDSTYKIHTKFSTGVGVNKVGVVMEQNLSGDTKIKLAANNTSTTSGADWNQQFIIHKYLSSPAQFTGGFPATEDKYLNKPIDISSKESLALLEPYIVGTDTLVRVQDNPVYGEQSEWMFYDTEDKHNVRIRYTKTGQYLYLNVTDTFSNAPGDAKLILKTKQDTTGDVRYHFRLHNSTGTSTNDWTINSALGNDNYNQLYIDGDNNLAIKPSYANSTYTKPNNFYLNLSLPAVASRLWAIATNDKGHLVSDSGISTPGTTLTHIATADESALWHFIPTPDNHFWIKNNLTKMFIYNNGNTSGGLALTNTTDSLATGTKWDLVRDGNCFDIQNVYSGKFMGLLNHPEEGQPVYQGTLGAGGEKWLLMRSSADDPPMITTTHANATLISPYSPFSKNSSNDVAYLDKMMQNLGFPFEPSVHYQLIAASFISDEYGRSGISTSPRYPSFVAVLRTALAYKFGWSSSQVDMAIANYKLDSVTNRTDAIFALRSFITDNLGMRSRSTWSFDEVQLVSYLERTMKALKTNYSAKITKSWENFLITSNPASDNDVLFSDLLYDIPDASKYVLPDYIPYTDDELASLIEYGAVANQKNYRNPLFMQISPAASVPAGLLIAPINAYSFMYRQGVIDRIARNFSNEDFEQQMADIGETAAEGADEVAAPIAEGGTEAANAAYLSNEGFGGISVAEESTSVAITSFGEVAGPATIAVVAIEILVMKAIQAAQFDHFTHRIYDKANRLKNYDEDITRILQGNHLLEKIQLYQDLDYVLGTGIRFNDPYGSTNTITFTGSGNWNDAGNWENGRVPANPVPVGTAVVINPVYDIAECLLNVPVTIPTGATLTIKPGKKLRVASQLTVPSAVSKQ